MDRLFSIGLTIGFFVSGVAAILVSMSQQLGIALIITSLILAFLFIYPKSPARKYWWSVSSRLGVVKIGEYEIVADNYITIHVGLRAVSVIQVDKIGIRIKGTQIFSDWNPMRVEADEARYINFKRPDWLSVGEYNVRLIAFTPDGFSRSEKFLIKVNNP